MPCKCDPVKKRRGECCCRNTRSLSSDNPRTALNPTVCSPGHQCGMGLPVRTTNHKERRMKKRERDLRRNECCSSDLESLETSETVESGIERQLNETQWQNEDFHSNSPSTIEKEEEEREGVGRICCRSDKRRMYLKAKLKELLEETRSIAEINLPEDVEVKPEPEVIAAVLLMSEEEGADLGKIKPDNVFNRLFSSSSPDRAVAIASAAPEPMSDVVVPVAIQGQKSPPLDVPNLNTMVERAKGIAAPNPNAFQQSEVFNSFFEHRNEILDRTPTSTDISGYLGTLNQQTPQNNESENGIMEYVIKPEPPPYRNLVQLNGSARPSWFPGFVVVSPELPGYIKISPNAGEALRDAWRLCSPRHFDELSKSLVNTG